MPTTYTAADGEVLDQLADVMRKHHPTLYEAGVRIGVLMAASDTGHAVTANGYPALAAIKVISLKDRVLKGKDAELVLDLRAFEELTPAQQDALLDHELSHIALKKHWYVAIKDADGEPTGETELKFDEDDLGRPKLASVKGDWSGGDAFAAVIARHGRAAIEFRNAKEFASRAERAMANGERGMS